MKGLLVLVLVAALTFASLPARVEGNGWTCFYCTIVTNTLFEYTLTHGNDMGQALEQVSHSSPPPLLRFVFFLCPSLFSSPLVPHRTIRAQVCYLFPQEYQRTCQDIVFVAGPIILNYYVAGSTPVRAALHPSSSSRRTLRSL